MLPTADGMLTVDELAARAGVTVRTVRFYASRGLLSPPQLRGRVGLYGREHLARLELIRELQALGYTLAAIERYLQRIPADASPEDLALQRALLAPWVEEQREELDRHELSRRAGRHLDDAALVLLSRLGAVDRVGDDVYSVSMPLLGIALQVLDLRLPLETLVAARSTVERHAGDLARDLSQLFRDEVLRPYKERGRPPDERDQVLDVLDKLKPITIQFLIMAFQRAVNQEIRGHIPQD